MKQIGNNEQFNVLLNSCRHPRLVYNALMAAVKPGVKQSDDMREERQIGISELLTLFDVAQSD